MLRIARYGNSRYWAVRDEQDLVGVTRYKRGAREVQRRLAAQPPAQAEAAAQAAAVEAAAPSGAAAPPARRAYILSPPQGLARRRAPKSG